MVHFDVGDKAVYPTQGVAEVIGVEEKEISGKIMRFYSLRLLDTGLKILVPVDKAEQVGLREVVGERQIREVFDILKEKDIPIDRQTWNRRYRGFMEKLKTGSLFEVAEVYRDLSRLKLTKTLSFGERKMLDTARNLIVKELSVAKRTTEVKVEQEIERIFAS
jgi:CarD family transcriptional regulator